MKKEELTNFEMVYIIYCKTMFRYLIDPFCLAISVFIVDNPLENLFLLSFVYFSIHLLSRIPMMFFYHDIK